MARISYDDQTAAAYKAVREVPRDGLGAWREAVRRHLRPSPRMTVVDIGAGTGAFAAAFSDWFDLAILAVEPSAAMRAQIPRRPGIRVLGGHASALPQPDHSADGAWLSLVIHHIPDLEAAACEIRRVLRPGAPVLIRQGFSGRADMTHTFPWEFFPETARTVTTYPSAGQACRAFATAGFRRDALEQVPETLTSLAGSSTRRTTSAAPTPTCAASPRRSSCGARNGSAAPCSTPSAQLAWRPEPTGLTFWSCADQRRP
jgi:ubiquinone/menaquinone biosynthesis C-methylase UbiE